AQIHPHFPFTEAGDDAVRSRGHRLHRVVIGERAEHDLDRLGELTRTAGPVQALADEPLRLVLVAGLSVYLVAGVEVPRRHVPAHVSEADESDGPHGSCSPPIVALSS